MRKFYMCLRLFHFSCSILPFFATDVMTHSCPFVIYCYGTRVEFSLSNYSSSSDSYPAADVSGVYDRSNRMQSLLSHPRRSPSTAGIVITLLFICYYYCLLLLFICVYLFIYKTYFLNTHFPAHPLCPAHTLCRGWSIPGVP